MERLPRCGAQLAVLLLVLAGEVAATVQDAPDTLRLEVVLDAVRTANPGLNAARLMANVAEERVPVAGSLPDPMLSLGLMNRPVDDLGLDQAMTMNSVQLSQRFPWPGVRSAARERAGRLAQAGHMDAAETERALVARAKGLYYALAQVQRAISVTESTRALLRDFVDVATSQYAVGSSPQQDILQAQVAVAEATADLTALEERRRSLAARLNDLMNRAPTDSVGALALPPPGPGVPTVDALVERATANRPALEAARLRIQAAEAGLRSAERAKYPDLTFTLGYGQRPRFDDLATLMVGISLPAWSGSKQEPVRREMEAMRAVEESRERDLYSETLARLTELRARAERDRSLYDLYASSILPQAAAAVESAMSAYRVGNVDYMTLLSNQTTLNRFQIESLRLAADYHSAVAEIEALTGTASGDES